MSSDRSWISRPRMVRGVWMAEFENGVDEFFRFAIEHGSTSDDMMRCPCTKCKNYLVQSLTDVKYHLYKFGFEETYTFWNHHGETVRTSPVGNQFEREPLNYANEGFDQFAFLRDVAGPGLDAYTESRPECGTSNNEHPSEEARRFYSSVEDAKVAIYPGNEKHSKLSVVTKLLGFKNRRKCSNKGFDELLQILDDILPEGHTLPKSYYEVKQMVKGLKLEYKKIDACENDCMLFYGDDSDYANCTVCGTSRYKQIGEQKKKSVPRKILRYFPLAPRLQRLFMSTRTTEYMRWHKNRNVEEGKLTHPADGEEWKLFDERYPDFSKDIRNVRIGLATDGFCPFSNTTSRQYSVWPVIVVVYNLPPSMCMKDPFMFTTLIIPGDKSPTRDINVYLRPLIDELKMLWYSGIETYDSFVSNPFRMRAALLWTINDFSALGMVSGWSTHGKLACPVCLGEVKGRYLYHSRKCSFWGTAKRFVIKGGIRRKTGEQVLSECRRIRFHPHGKGFSKKRAVGFGETHNWTHLSIFFELPYWSTLKVRHCIDVMHTEKNVFDNIFYTLLDAKNKSKYHIEARRDCMDWNILPHLWLTKAGTKPRASFNPKKPKLLALLTWVNNLRLPDGYASNIARCSNLERQQFQGMKSHDCHVFMQKLLPVAFREILPDEVLAPLSYLSSFFKDVCSTVLLSSDLAKLEKNIARTMVTLENIFPPSFFDSMEHLPIHLPEQIRYTGPVQFSWMYPFERNMRGTKEKVGNKAHVEGSIAERYIEQELVYFSELYFGSEVETVHNRLGRNEVATRIIQGIQMEAFKYPTKYWGGEDADYFSDQELQLPHQYVWDNMPEVEEMKRIFESEVRNCNFADWLAYKNDPLFHDLLRGPVKMYLTYLNCKVNGYRFKCCGETETTSPNSGVLVKGSVNGGKECNYYGVLKTVILMNYGGDTGVVLFKCRWFDMLRGVKVDSNGVVLVDVQSKYKGADVFILASQATQVYYAPQVLTPDSRWRYVITTQRRVLDETTHQPTVEDALQEDVSNAASTSSLPFFVDFGRYQMQEVEENAPNQVEPDEEEFDAEEEEFDDEESEENVDGEDSGYESVD